jgi:sulfite reductase (NADPH) hemoprotein beta-component
MAEIAKIHQGDFRLSPNQNIIIAGVPSEQVATIDYIARQYGLIDESVTEQRKASMACVSYPTCPLAMAEAERVLPEISVQVDDIMQRHGLSDKAFVFRITGCPNGCGRAMLAEVGLVGRAVGRYDLYIGGNAEGTRIPRLHQSNQPIEDILNTIDRYVEQWSENGQQDERFGDFAVRTGIVKPVLNSTIDFHLVE